MFITIQKLIEKYGRDKSYIFFRVSEHRNRTQVSILGHYTNGKFYDYSYFGDSYPVSLVSAMGVSGLELEFYRAFDIMGDELEIMANDDAENILNRIVDYSFMQGETNDGRTVKFQSGVYAMLGSVKEEYYDVTVTRTGFARVKACSYEDACEAVAKLKDKDVSWSDSWEFDCIVSTEQNLNK